MKRITGLILAFIMIISLCSCNGGSFEAVNLQDKIEIPADGIITSNIIKQIKNKNAIGCFYGENNGFKYEWTIFGSDIENAADINLLTDISETDNGDIKVSLQQTDGFGFSALLSVYLNKEWDSLSATAYNEDKAVSSVSLTGTEQTILNLSTNGTMAELTIRPDELPKTATNTQKPDKQTQSTNKQTISEYNDYLSASNNTDIKVYSDGKDKYLTDPVPAGKPEPVEPENQDVNKGKAYSCTFSIKCSTILNNLDQLDPDKLEMVPSDGTILATTKVTFYEGESVFDVLQRVCKEKGIHLESTWTPIYNSAYIEGIHNLYEFDCGALSGWMYRVNGWYPNYGCSRYQLKDGDVVEWRYTCDLGNDIGGKNVF